MIATMSLHQSEIDAYREEFGEIAAETERDDDAWYSEQNLKRVTANANINYPGPATVYETLDDSQRAEIVRETKGRLLHALSQGKVEYQYWKYHGIKTHGCIFLPGERVEHTLFTVVGHGFTNRYGKMTWKFVKCKCDCGTVVDVPYQALYQAPPKYSCGCKMRPKQGAKDYRGLEIKGYYTTRTLTIIDYDDSVGEWRYLCDCCAEIMNVPRGMEGTIPIRLKRIANQPCANQKTSL